VEGMVDGVMEGMADGGMEGERMVRLGSN
jgi:hypothetical protein